MSGGCYSMTRPACTRPIRSAVLERSRGGSVLDRLPHSLHYVRRMASRASTTTSGHPFSTASSPGEHEDDRCRVVIERVQPEVDGGRFPIKRVTGESVRVTAWIHVDSHDLLAAVVRYRPVSDPKERPEWFERPMVPLGNDEWVATFDIEQPCTYEYTVHAWVDRFESWRRGLAAKFEARQDVSSELLVGAALLRLIATRGRGARAPEAAERRTNAC